MTLDLGLMALVSRPHGHSVQASLGPCPGLTGPGLELRPHWPRPRTQASLTQVAQIQPK